jgi:hypothetical protein
MASERRCRLLLALAALAALAAPAAAFTRCEMGGRVFACGYVDGECCAGIEFCCDRGAGWRCALTGEPVCHRTVVGGQVVRPPTPSGVSQPQKPRGAAPQEPQEPEEAEAEGPRYPARPLNSHAAAMTQPFRSGRAVRTRPMRGGSAPAASGAAQTKPARGGGGDADAGVAGIKPPPPPRAESSSSQGAGSEAGSPGAVAARAAQHVPPKQAAVDVATPPAQAKLEAQVAQQQKEMPQSQSAGGRSVGAVDGSVDFNPPTVADARAGIDDKTTQGGEDESGGAANSPADFEGASLASVEVPHPRPMRPRLVIMRNENDMIDGVPVNSNDVQTAL